MPRQRTALTYTDYAALPDDGRRYEVHDGELSVTPAPGPGHQRVSGNLSDILRPYVQRHGLGEVLYAPLDCILSADTVVQPDLIHLDRGRAHLVSRRGIEGPPTLVVEIVSPSTRLIDRERKRQIYARHGVPYYWIVDPDQRAIEAYALSDAGYELAARASGPEAMS